MSAPDTNNDRISIPLMLAFPVVAINTFEMTRAIQVVGAAAKERKRVLKPCLSSRCPHPITLKPWPGRLRKAAEAR